MATSQPATIDLVPPETPTQRNLLDTALVLTAAASLLVSGWVHFYLYFRGGYRGIAPESLAGITISRAFALNAIAAVIIAEALVLALIWQRLLLPAALAGIGFSIATLLAYSLSRTTGLLGFSETTTTTEAVIGIIAEGTATLTLATRVARLARNRHTAT
jgi:hypothetical protein